MVRQSWLWIWWKNEKNGGNMRVIWVIFWVLQSNIWTCFCTKRSTFSIFILTWPGPENTVPKWWQNWVSLVSNSAGSGPNFFGLRGNSNFHTIWFIFSNFSSFQLKKPWTKLGFLKQDSDTGIKTALICKMT